MGRASPFAQVLWACSRKVRDVLGAQTPSLRRQLWLFAAVPSSLSLPQLWWQNEKQLPPSCFSAKSKSLVQAAPTPLGILCFKHWILSWSSLELSVFSVCWLHYVGGILWETGNNILNWHSYFQNNHFHAPLAAEASISFASFRLV